MTDQWRVGNKVPLNVYEGDRPVCQCHNPGDAARIVEAVNRMAEFKRIHDECHAQRDALVTRVKSLQSRVDALERKVLIERRHAQGYGFASN